MNIPSISLKQLKANLTTSALESALNLLSQPGTVGLLVIENRDILSPNKGRKSVLAFGPAIATRKDLDVAIAQTNGDPQETPIAVIERSAVRDEIAAQACVEIQNITESVTNPTTALTEVQQVLTKAHTEIKRFA